MLSSSKKKGGKITALTVAAATSLFLYIANATTQGVIGDFSTAEFPKLAIALTTTHIPLFVLLLFCVTALCGGYAWWQRGKTKDQEMESIINISGQLISMDSLIFLCIQSMIDARKDSLDELDKVTKKVIEALLGQATPMFRRAVYSGAFFALDGNVLRIWAHYQMSQADVEDEDIQFDLSQPARLPIGMARASYEKRMIEVGCIEEDENGWRCTNQHYIKIGRLAGPIQTGPPRPPYSSLICVPVISSLQRHQEPLGVVCFSSHERSTFDDPQINFLAEQIVGRISEALQFYHYLKKGALDSARPLG